MRVTKRIMTKKVKTMKVSGGDYAKVNDRMLEFRTENPRGLIETSYTIAEDSIIFKARILKDKENPASGEANGHSMGKGTGAKVFEKQETIAVGRALAFLGYSANGEIASSEEMEEFEEHQQELFMEKLDEATENLRAAKTQQELKDAWLPLEPQVKKALETLKEECKQKLNEKNTNGAELGGVATVA